MDFNRNYSSMKKDPQLLLTVIGKYVKVEIVKEVTFSGYIIALDPESYSVVLAVLHEGNIFKNVLVPGHAILNMTEDMLPIDAKPFVISPRKRTPENLLERKAKLMSWLKKNLLPISELDENIILGNACIIPPYSLLDICGENPIVVNQVKNMISKMPDA